MGADCLGCADGGEGLVGDVESGFGGTAQQPGLGAAGVDDTLDTEDGFDMILPVGVIKFTGGSESCDGAAFVSTAPLAAAMAGTQRLGRGGKFGDRLEQGRLVAFDLNDEVDVGLLGDLEGFF